MDDWIYSLWEKGYRSKLQQRILCLLKRYGIFGKREVFSYLDLGNGDSSFYKEISFLTNAARVFTSDIYERGAHYKKHTVCDFNGKSLPFKDNSFDLITCINVVEHLFDTDSFLLEVRRILKRKGVFIIATNNISCWTNIVALVFGKQPNANHISDYGDFGRFLQKDCLSSKKCFRHRRIFSLSGMEKVLQFHGFRVIVSKRGIFYPFGGWIERFFEIVFNIYCAYIVVISRKY